jgi:cell division protein FtsW (lipid II flippase)
VTGLLPDVVREAIHDRSIYSASESFGVVGLVLLVALLLELEALRVMHRSREHTVVLQAVALPLLVSVVLTIALRVTGLLPGAR